MSSKKEVEIKRKKTKKENLFKVNEVIFLVLLTCVVSLAVGALVFSNSSLRVEKAPSNIVGKSGLEEFIANYNFIVDNYQGDLDQEKLIKDAIEGMVSGIDDAHTSFIDQIRDESFNIRLNGSYTGLGVEIISNEEGYITVVGVFENSPAAISGLKVGDVIVKLNGEDIKGVASSDFSNKVMNELEGKVDITIDRDGVEHSLVLEKGQIEINSVHEKTFNHSGKVIAYLSIDVFALNTYTQFKTALESFENKGFDSLIIDVRGNSGGHLNVVKNMISLFFDSNTVIYQTDTKGKIEKFKSTGKTTKDYPIVILGDSGSASASEIMIGALKEKYGATFVGQQTFGKGTVQEVQTISTGDQYKVTTKNWLTAKGNVIDSVGISPDVELQLGEEYFANPSDETDNQLQKALELLAK